MEKTIWRSHEREAELHCSEWKLRTGRRTRQAGLQEVQTPSCTGAGEWRGSSASGGSPLGASSAHLLPPPPGQTASTSVPFSTEELPPSPQLLFLVANHRRLLCPCHPDSEPPTCSADMAHPDGVPRSPPSSLSFPVRNGHCFLQFGEKPPKVPTCSALPSPSPLLLSKWTRG